MGIESVRADAVSNHSCPCGGVAVIGAGSRGTLPAAVARRARPVVPRPIREAVHALLRRGAGIAAPFRDLRLRPVEAAPKALEISLDHPFSRTKATVTGAQA